MSRYFELFYSFFKIGLFTFGGGYAMIPIIQREMIDRRHWIEEKEFFDLLTLAQSAPGPIALNTAVFVGYKLYGYWGAIVSLLGVVIPSFSVILFVAIFFSQIRENAIVDAAFKGMRPVVVALMLAPILGFVRGMRWWAVAVACGVAIAIWHFGFSPIYLLVAGAVAGLLWAAARGKEVEK
ncbi:MAG: chromate transporter [Rikenellaceae bacterium]|nr:chromate transporter [Rikenellaceae bacterium]